MANNYRQFSAVLALETAEERAWAEAELHTLQNTCEDGSDPEEGYELSPYESQADFQFEVNDRDIWFCSEENGNIEHIASFVQDFLQRFRPNDCFYMAYADTCSKPRVDEFSGGAVFVSAKEVRYINANDWARNTAEAFRAGTLSPEAHRSEYVERARD